MLQHKCDFLSKEKDIVARRRDAGVGVDGGDGCGEKWAAALSGAVGMAVLKLCGEGSQGKGARDGWVRGNTLCNRVKDRLLECSVLRQ